MYCFEAVVEQVVPQQVFIWFRSWWKRIRSGAGFAQQCPQVLHQRFGADGELHDSGARDFNAGVDQQVLGVGRQTRFWSRRCTAVSTGAQNVWSGL